jgi:hypothetical protein
MYIMVKVDRKSQLFGPDQCQVLSILESRKTNHASYDCSAEDYNLRSTPKRMASAAKLVQYQRGLRNSSFIDKWYECARNKGTFREYGKEGPRSPVYNSAHLVCAPILGIR